MPIYGTTPDATTGTKGKIQLAGDLSGTAALPTIGAGKVTQAMLDTNAGGIGAAWASFTPSWANVTVGNGTNTGWYLQIGKTVFVKTRFVMGSTSTMGAAVLTLPVTASANAMVDSLAGLGSIFIQDSGTAVFNGGVRYRSTTTVDPFVWTASGTYVIPTTFSSTVPMTWTTNDNFIMQFFYEAA